MNLRRYNEILFAVVVTAAAVACMIHVARTGWQPAAAGSEVVVPRVMDQLQRAIKEPR